MKSALLNLDKDTEKLRVSMEHLATFGIVPERIPGILDEDHERGFSLAMIEAIKAIRDEDVAVIFEDDILLTGWDIPQLPEVFDMVYLGANLQGPTERINERLIKITAAWTTHAVIYSRKGAEKVLSQYKVEYGVYDNWLKEHFHKDNNCYLVTPMIAYQRPGYSEIKDVEVDYTEVMNINYNTYAS